MKRRVAAWASNEAGSAMVELALALPVLTLLVVAATDYALERVAEAQTQAAVIAASEYAATKGCIASGIQAAAADAVDRTFNRWLVTVSSVTSTGFCACGFADSSLNALSTVGASTDAPACTQSADVCTVGTNSIPAAPYVAITATASYAPLLPRIWGAASRSISSRAVVRTFGTQSVCNG
jgi:hypothetical protein